MAPEEIANIQVTIKRGVSLGHGRDVYEGDKIEVTAREAAWLLSGEQPYAVAGWQHPEQRTLDEGLATREGKKSK